MTRVAAAGVNRGSAAKAPCETPSGPTAAPGSRVRCSRCCAEALEGTVNCPACGVFLPRNEAALKHGLRRYQDRGELPAEVNAYIVEFREQLVSDQGGEQELTAIRQGLVDKLPMRRSGIVLR